MLLVFEVDSLLLMINCVKKMVIFTLGNNVLQLTSESDFQKLNCAIVPLKQQTGPSFNKFVSEKC